MIKLYIVTDDPQRASIDCFGLDAEYAPAWAQFVQSPWQMMAVPNGARVFPSWHGTASEALLRDLWFEERRKHGRSFRDDWAACFDMLKAWRDRRRGLPAETAAAPETALPAPQPVPAGAVPATAIQQVSPKEQGKTRWW